jgi:hypothetical protein
MTIQEQLARGIRSSLKEGLREFRSYFGHNTRNQPIGGCVATMAVCGVTGKTLDQLEKECQSARANTGVNTMLFYADITGMPFHLLDNMETAHLDGHSAAEIADMLEKNKFPEVGIGSFSEIDAIFATKPEKEFTMTFAESGKEIEKFTLSGIITEMSDSENYFPIAEQSSESQQKMAEFKRFIETAEINETLTVDYITFRKIVYKRVS